ncbi:hypothetical protein [Bradyrhizobium sp. LA7.1]|uniref:hypothetical protein n=1 Tax=Bradyrhizobium sp. LA7.1 TaxID=3156324 RepID=UPI00339748E6
MSTTALPDESGGEMPQLMLNRNAIRQPVQTAVVRSTEMVDFAFAAMSSADLSKPPQGSNFINFKSPDLSAEDRKAAYEAWILARGFHDVVRGAKETLEQAHVYLGLLDKKPETQDQIESLTTRLKSKAQYAGFEDLLTATNKRLTVPLEFPSALLSLQQARNCLEHRGGIVGAEDCKGAPTFKLSFPRLKLFYVRDGAEVELTEGSIIEPGAGQTHAQIMVRLELQTREFAIGDRLSFSASEFNSIAFAVMQMGEHVANRLPPVQDAVSAPAATAHAIQTAK